VWLALVRGISGFLLTYYLRAVKWTDVLRLHKFTWTGKKFHVTANFRKSNSFFTPHSFFRMNVPVPVTSIETLPTELLEWLGEKKIKPGDGDLWVRKTLEIQKDFAFSVLLVE
jgi:hypothetical protein